MVEEAKGFSWSVPLVIIPCREGKGPALLLLATFSSKMKAITILCTAFYKVKTKQQKKYKRPRRMKNFAI